jgi:hypothetical protein
MTAKNILLIVPLSFCSVISFSQNAGNVTYGTSEKNLIPVQAYPSLNIRQSNFNSWPDNVYEFNPGRLAVIKTADHGYFKTDNYSFVNYFGADKYTFSNE